jgi:hypothetical protein
MAWRGETIGGTDSGQPRHRSDAIEAALDQHRKSLFGTISVACFDTTSRYFAGHGGATLGRRGHSKDFRRQLPQLVLGIVPDEPDRPTAAFPWPGNTADACPRAWPGGHHPAGGGRTAAPPLSGSAKPASSPTAA